MLPHFGKHFQSGSLQPHWWAFGGRSLPVLFANAGLAELILGQQYILQQRKAGRVELTASIAGWLPAMLADLSDLFKQHAYMRSSTLHLVMVATDSLKKLPINCHNASSNGQCDCPSC
jgi:hypothetical protein